MKMKMQKQQKLTTIFTLGDKMAVLRAPIEFDSRIWKYINDLRRFDPSSDYIPRIQKQIPEIQADFPFIKFCILPYSNGCLAILEGKLIKADYFAAMDLSIDDLDQHSLPIIAVIHRDFESRGITVFDSHRRFNVELIPNRIRHFSRLDHGLYAICTHSSRDITPKTTLVAYLQSAWNLFIEYQRFDRTGEFLLECREHEYGG